MPPVPVIFVAVEDDQVEGGGKDGPRDFALIHTSLQIKRIRQIVYTVLFIRLQRVYAAAVTVRIPSPPLRDSRALK